MSSALPVLLAASSKRLFDPSQVAGNVLWLDANAPSSVLSDGAANFTAANTQYLTAGKALLSSGSFTFATWIKFTSAGTTVRFMSNSVTGSTDRQFINISSSKFGCTAGTTAQGGTTTVSTGTWYFVVFTNDGVNSTLYLNNAVEVAAFADAPLYTSVNNFYIGTGAALTTTLNGVNDSTGVWNRVLTAAEMTYLYNAGAGRVYADLGVSGTDGSALGTSLNGWYDMDAEIGTRFDKSGNGNHLTASNTAIISGATLNGNFETAGGGGADVFASWTEATTGISTVNAETVTPLAGTQSLRLDIDASNSAASVAQTVLTVGNRYNVSLLAKASAGTPTLSVGGVATSDKLSFTLSTSAVTYSGSFIAAGTSFKISNNSAASASLYVDTVVLTGLGPVGTTGIAAGTASDGNFCGQFNGTTQSLSITNAAQTGLSIGTSDFAVSMWVNPDSTLGTPYILAKGGTSAAVKGYNLWLSSGLFRAGLADGTTTANYSSTSTLANGSWYHLVASFSRAGNVSFYVNGVAAGTADISAYAGTDLSASSAFAIGATQAGAANFSGRIDGVGVWTRTLSAGEVTTLFNTGMGLKYAGLTTGLKTSLSAYWDLDKKAGITADSASTNTLTNNGTVTSGQGVSYFSGVAKKWVDKSGSNNHAMQTTQSARPAWQSGVQNGRPGILFDGISSTLSLTGMSIPAGNFTFFAAFNPTTAATAKYIFDTGTGRLVFAQGSGSGTPTKVGWFDGSWHDIANATTGVQILTFNLNSTGTAGAIYRNASQLGSSAAYTQTAIGASVAIGSAFGANGNFLAGTIHEIILYTSALSAADQTRVVNYLNAKYAIY